MGIDPHQGINIWAITSTDHHQRSRSCSQMSSPMLAMSSPLFSPDGWLSDDSSCRQQQQQQQLDYQQHFSCLPRELQSPPQQSLLHFHFSQPSDPPQQVNRFDPVTPSPTPISSDPSLVKKLNHNASERDRRRKINGLYSSLRSSLPASDQTKKLSIPATVTRALKYIPELQRQVQKLAKEKEELLKRIPSKIKAEEDGPPFQQRINGSQGGTVFANLLSEREAAVQISTRKETESPLSEIMLSLERGGFSLISASTSESSGDGRAFYTLHVQAERTNDASGNDKLREKMLSLCRMSDRCGFQRRPDIH